MAETVRLTRDIPVADEVDVIVAGAGVAGVTAAIAAAREGARTVLVDRFGFLGGNMGPGMFSGGVVHLALKYPLAMTGRLQGIPGEIINRCEGFGGGLLGHNYFKDSQAVTYVLFKMMEENNVRLMLNTFAADPIVRDGAVVGLIVEDKSGTQAVKAKVVIDCTADADIAFRAGCPCAGGERYVHPGMYFAIGNVDTARYEAWVAEAQASDDDVKWVDDIAHQSGGRMWAPKPFYTLFRQAWYLGEYHFIRRIGDIGAVWPDHGIYKPFFDGIMGAQLGVHGPNIQSGDAAMMTRIETACRVYIYETALFFQRRVPGFDKSYLFAVSPYFHTRGGRSILGEYVMTEQDFEKGRRFDDVIFANYAHERSKAVAGGCDFPYRQLLPKGVKGLMAAGKSAILQPPPNRTRWKCFLMGQAAGVAAALAVRTGTAPGEIDVKELQRILHFKYHAPLGDKPRLQKLGLLPQEPAAAKPRRKPTRPRSRKGVRS